MKPNRRLGVFATREEYEKLKDNIGVTDRVMITGEGYANIIEALKDIDKDTVIINVGYCGSNSLPIGTKVRVNKCHCYHPQFSGTDVKYDDPVYTLDPGGTADCYTAGDFVLETDITKPVVFDMELYAICALGFTSVVGIKIVSDNLSLHEYRATSGIKVS